MPRFNPDHYSVELRRGRQGLRGGSIQALEDEDAAADDAAADDAAADDAAADEESGSASGSESGSASGSESGSASGSESGSASASGAGTLKECETAATEKVPLSRLLPCVSDVTATLIPSLLGISALHLRAGCYILKDSSHPLLLIWVCVHQACAAMSGCADPVCENYYNQVSVTTIFVYLICVVPAKLASQDASRPENDICLNISLCLHEVRILECYCLFRLPHHTMLTARGRGLVRNVRHGIWLLCTLCRGTHPLP